MPIVHVWQSLGWQMSILRALVHSGKSMTASGRQETPNFEIWASALEKLLGMASAKSKV